MAQIRTTILQGFEVDTACPLDNRDVVADLAARNSLPSSALYVGLTTYVLGTNTRYELTSLSPTTWIELYQGVSDSERNEIVANSAKIGLNPQQITAIANIPTSIVDLDDVAGSPEDGQFLSWDETNSSATWSTVSRATRGTSFPANAVFGQLFRLDEPIPGFSVGWYLFNDVSWDRITI